MRCLDFTPENVVVVTTAIECSPSQYVLVTYDELSAYTASPFRLTAAEGGLLSAAVIGVWATAFVFRAVVKVFTSGDPET
ncbi:MAG: phage coat protein [Hydrogenophaga sp.]|nr:phage coat protein [Hydrogenophaga sp.]